MESLAESEKIKKLKRYPVWEHYVCVRNRLFVCCADRAGVDLFVVWKENVFKSSGFCVSFLRIKNPLRTYLCEVKIIDDAKTLLGMYFKNLVDRLICRSCENFFENFSHRLVLHSKPCSSLLPPSLRGA